MAKRPIGIFGAGGMARDAMHTLDAAGVSRFVTGFYEDDAIWRERQIYGIPVLPVSQLDHIGLDVVVAIGDGTAREAVVARMPTETRFPVYIHPSVCIGRNVTLGEGTFICANSILTNDIVLGRHVQLNIGTTITHDCRVEDFVTSGPGARLSGNCTVGNGAYLGTGCLLREGTRVPPRTVVGMGAVVVRSIEEPGIYVGNPARKKP